MENKADPRTKDYPLMSSPFPTIAICLSYAYFVKVLGPKLMENRKPFQLRTVLVVYNFAQVLFSAWLFYETARGCWWYFFSKFTEFFDTFFFVMRKRYDQVSTLHVIHHGIMPFSVWWGVKYTPGGHSTFFGFLNTFVHIVMYTYYMLAAMGPKVQKYLWWKKYLTLLQMVQFVLVMVHSFQLFFKNDCNYPIGFAYFIGAHALMFYFLFTNFYKTRYLNSEKKNKAAAAAVAAAGLKNNGHPNGILKSSLLQQNGNIAKYTEINGNTKFASAMTTLAATTPTTGSVTTPNGNVTRQRIHASTDN
uniref:Elongation of very long chain fatty acids protein n=1 Tax=Glossina palpalis gambiensis TaxID=67801 RepID=A0A1B0BMI3_9MUSC